MKIGIDARLYGLRHAGIGRYTQNLIGELAKIDRQNHYLLFVTDPKVIDPLPDNFQLVGANIRHYTWAEQTQFLRLLNSYRFDFLHATHFNVPFFYRRPFIVTIHDLLWHHKIGLSVTTLNPAVYLIKYLGYRATVRNAVSRAVNIITPTRTIASSVQRHFRLQSTKLAVTYEAAAPVFSHKPRPSAVTQSLKQFKLTPPFIIYTGSLYPHKNVTTLINSLRFLPPTLSLAIVSSRDVFTQKTEAFVTSIGLSSRVKFLGYQPDDVLVGLYQTASALVLPSLSEGFGLTGLEAMAARLPVVCSKHSVLSEIYGSAPLYTDTAKPQVLAATINRFLTDKDLSFRHRQLGLIQAQKYSWSKMAEATLDIYQQTYRQLTRK